MESLKAAVRAYEASRLGGGRCRELRKFFNFVAMKGGNACDLTITCKGKPNDSGHCNTIQTDCVVEGKKYVKRTRKQEESVDCPNLSDEIKAMVDGYLEKRGAEVIECVGFKYQPQLQDLPESIDDNLFEKILDEIHYLHTKHKLFHGDLHRGNIMLNPENGQPVIIDFDSAQQLGSDGMKKRLQYNYEYDYLDEDYKTKMKPVIEKIDLNTLIDVAKASDYERFVANNPVKYLDQHTMKVKYLEPHVKVSKVIEKLTGAKPKTKFKFGSVIDYLKAMVKEATTRLPLEDATNRQ